MRHRYRNMAQMAIVNPEQYLDKHAGLGSVLSFIPRMLAKGTAATGAKVGTSLLKSKAVRNYGMNVGLMAAIEAGTNSDSHPNQGFAKRFGGALLNPYVHASAYAAHKIIPIGNRFLGNRASNVWKWGLQGKGLTRGAARRVGRFFTLTSPELANPYMNVAQVGGGKTGFLRAVTGLGNTAKQELAYLTKAKGIASMSTSKFNSVRNKVVQNLKAGLAGADEATAAAINADIQAAQTMSKGKMLLNKKFLPSFLENAGVKGAAALENPYAKDLSLQMMNPLSPNGFAFGAAATLGGMTGVGQSMGLGGEEEPDLTPSKIPVLGDLAHAYMSIWSPSELEHHLKNAVSPLTVPGTYDYSKLSGSRFKPGGAGNFFGG